MLKDYNSFVNMILEKSLSFKDLLKDDIRFNNFIDKLVNNKKFTLPNGSEVNISNASDILKEIGYPKEDLNTQKQNFKDLYTRKKFIQTSSGNISLSGLEKTTEFGSSKGSSAGSKETKVFETIQLIFINLMLDDVHEGTQELHDINQYRLNEISLPDGIIDELYNFGLTINTPINVTKDQLKKYCSDKVWLNTFIRVSNVISRYIVSEKEYVLYHRDYTHFEKSTFIPSLNSIANMISSVVKNQHGIQIDKNKWNPCDIWIMSKKDGKNYNIDIINNIKDQKDKLSDIVRTYKGEELKTHVDDFLRNFNMILKGYFDSNDLIGVSLKEVGEPRDKIIDGTKIPHYKISGYDFENKKGVNIHTEVKNDIKGVEKGKINFRGFEGQHGFVDIQGEVIGSTARHGKVSLEYINFILKKYRITPIETKYTLNNETEQQLKDEINDIARNLKGDINFKIDFSKYTKFELITKYQGMMLIQTLYNNKDVCNNIITDMFLYALSIKNDLIGNAIYHLKIF